MEPFVKSQGCEYVLVAIDYASKWVEAMPCRAADANHARKMFHEIIFPRFGTPRMVISDGGSFFIDSVLAILKYPFYPLFNFDNGMNLISKSLTILTSA